MSMDFCNVDYKPVSYIWLCHIQDFILERGLKPFLLTKFIRKEDTQIFIRKNVMLQWCISTAVREGMQLSTIWVVQIAWRVTEGFCEEKKCYSWLKAVKFVTNECRVQYVYILEIPVSVWGPKNTLIRLP
jgi:hypothetical protein